MDELKLQAEFENVTPDDIYECWLDSTYHGEMTGAAAEIDPVVGGKHSAWDGYIWGVTLELATNERIVQSWRTADFAEDDEDSRLELLFESNGAEGTTLTLIHTNIPDGQGEDYLQGWEDHYFEPMRIYFEEESYSEVDDD